jgi:2-hydroxychromene-2-carboxylate isomerase
MTNAAPKLEFWYEFASTYSYLSAARIEALASEAKLEIVWRPFLLGPIFSSQGWQTSPFNLYPAKGRYMIRDLQRICAERGQDFQMPSPFPQNSLTAARLALVGVEEGWVAPFTRAVYAAEFGRGASIADKPELEAILREQGLDSARLFARIDDPVIKQRLKQQTAQAQEQGIFGAPTFKAPDGELFWGDDRLEQAIAWARRL